MARNESAVKSSEWEMTDPKTVRSPIRTPMRRFDNTAGSLPAVKGQSNGHTAKTEYGSCHAACNACYEDHYQGCLAYCVVGCQDYCMERPESGCEDSQAWTAEVAPIVEALNPHARMCPPTGLNGCPEPLRQPQAQPPMDPYGIERPPDGQAGSTEAVPHGSAEKLPSQESPPLSHEELAAHSARAAAANPPSLDHAVA